MSARTAILAAARADAIPEGKSGLWVTLKFASKKLIVAPRGLAWNGEKKWAVIPAGNYTQLWRLTLKDLNANPPGELVMQDTPDELKTHLNFMLRSHGDVLITGLGLGCVARGCLANPRVRSVTVLEQDRGVLELVRPYMPPAIRIIHLNAMSWAEVLHSQPLTQTYDCAWHDLWSDPDDEQAKHLQLMHSHLIALLCRRVRHFQGAWQLPRSFKTAVNRAHHRRRPLHLI